MYTVYCDTYCDSLPPSLPLFKDWFSTHLKQLVMELGRAGSGLMATDGASMSTMSSHLSDDETSEPERAPLDLTE